MTWLPIALTPWALHSRRKSPCCPWLYKVAHRQLLKANNARTRDREIPSDNATLDILRPLPSGGIAEFNDHEQQVLDAVKALPPKQRQVMDLTIAEFTPQEIADLLGCDPAAEPTQSPR